jgi:hypothetical protein
VASGNESEGGVITADQLLAHAVGDYILQSDWMANEKTRAITVATAHAVVYGAPFLLLGASWPALAVIVATHAAIDRWRLARFVVFAKNFLAPPNSFRTHYDETGVTAGGVPQFVEKTEVRRWWFRWKECAATGYHQDRPVWLATWLLIIADNVLHIAINGLALRFL